MKNKTIMKIISICFIFIVVFSMPANVYAAINENYGANKEAVVEPDLEGKLQNSILLEAIASLVYGLGSLAESLVGDAFYILTGENMFPWADRVIFNTIPFLDVNFLNPAKSSLFLDSSGKETILATIVRNMYFTVLVVSIGFLGIVVGVMAIRLALSTIAAEKAKYKQAITKFLVSLVMLFCVHYAISLIFYINESLVEVASDILIKSTADAKIHKEFFESSVTDAELVENFFKSQEGIFDKFEKEKDKILGDTEKTAIAAYLLKDGTYKKLAIPSAFGNGESEKSFLNKLANYMPWSWWDNNFSVDRLVSDIALVQNESEIAKLQKDIEQYSKNGAEHYRTNRGKEEFEKAKSAAKSQEITQGGPAAAKDWTPEREAEFLKEYDNEILPTIMKLKQLYINASTQAGRERVVTADTIITELGLYFKENAWTYETDEDGSATGWDNNSLSLQGALLYAIFVVQSILYFVAYIKRFFFVVILAILAPVIVIYDFLGKAIM